MFTGHYAVALAAKRWAPKAPLGALFLAVQGVDLLFVGFVLVGLEHLRLIPGFTASNAWDLYDIPYSHSLVATVGWSLATALGVWLWQKDRAVTLAVALCVFSHFWLDLPMHVKDLPVAGNDTVKLGFGLWNNLPVALALETAVVAAGLLLHWRHTRDTRPRFLAFAGTLLALTLALPFLPVMGGPALYALQGLATYLGLAAFARFVDRPALMPGTAAPRPGAPRPAS
jgi:hypothetical protein